MLFFVFAGLRSSSRISRQLVIALATSSLSLGNESRAFLSDTPICPECNSGFVYDDGNLHVCPECEHEWPIGAAGPRRCVDAGGGVTADVLVVRDANGNALSDGDSVTLIKDLKIKGDLIGRQSRH